MAPNPFLLAADDSPDLLPLLREKPDLASSQDEHGYSLVHAAASYNHLNLLRALIREFDVDVDLKDEDDETALFVVETPEAAKVLIEELGANFRHKGLEGVTAREKISEEGDFPAVVEYLARVDRTRGDEKIACTADSIATVPEAMPPPPEGMSLTFNTVNEAQHIPDTADPEFRRRIEELAQREDFDTPQGQEQLRTLVMDALTDNGFGADRSVKPRQD